MWGKEPLGEILARIDASLDDVADPSAASGSSVDERHARGVHGNRVE
jgi:hypothetical protein